MPRAFNLSNWEGEQEIGRRNGQMQLIFASFGTRRRSRGAGVGDCNRDCWYCLFCLCIVDPIGQIRYTRVSVLLAAFLLILAGQSDVHLKLSIISWLEWRTEKVKHEEKKQNSFNYHSLCTKVKKEFKLSHSLQPWNNYSALLWLVFLIWGKNKNGSQITHREEQLGERIQVKTFWVSLCPEVDQTGAPGEHLAIYQVSTFFWRLWTLALLWIDTLSIKNSFGIWGGRMLARVKGSWSAIQGVLQELAISTDTERTH